MLFLHLYIPVNEACFLIVYAYSMVTTCFYYLEGKVIVGCSLEDLNKYNKLSIIFKCQVLKPFGCQSVCVCIIDVVIWGLDEHKYQCISVTHFEIVV